MKSTPLVLLLVLGGAIALAVNQGWIHVGPAVPPSPTPTPPGPVIPPGPEMLAVFSANPDKDMARDHAVQSAAMFDSLSYALECDGRTTPCRIANTGQFEDYRVQIIRWTETPVRFGQMYPTFGRVVGGYLDVVTKDNVPFSEGQMREKWIAALNSLAQSCKAAAEKL